MASTFSEQIFIKFKMDPLVFLCVMYDIFYADIKF